MNVLGWRWSLFSAVHSKIKGTHCETWTHHPFIKGHIQITLPTSNSKHFQSVLIPWRSHHQTATNNWSKVQGKLLQVLLLKGISMDVTLVALVHCMCVRETGKCFTWKNIELDVPFNTTSPWQPNRRRELTELS